MAIWTYALTTLANLKEYLNITGTGTDTFLTSCIDRSSQAIELYCSRYLKSRTYTDEKYSGDGISSILVVRNYPLITITSLYDDPARDFGSSTLIATDDYQIQEDEGLIIRTDSAFALGTENIKITYSAGYATIPFDLEMACILLAAQYYFLSPVGKGRQGVVSEALPQGQGTIVFAHKSMPDEVTQLLGPYRRISVGG